MNSRSGYSTDDGLQGHLTSVISSHETKKRRHGRQEPTIIQRHIFFQGLVYVIDEEVYSDPDCSSKYTSEDSFDEDDDQLRKKFKQQNQVILPTDKDDQ